MCLINKNKKSLSLEVLDRAVLELWSKILWSGPKSLPYIKVIWLMGGGGGGGGRDGGWTRVTLKDV